MLFRLHHYRLDKAHGVNELDHFEEAYTSSHNMVRIYKIKDVDQESKAWTKARACSDLHAPCAQRREYPPALREVVKEGVDFSEIKRRLRLQAGKFD